MKNKDTCPNCGYCQHCGRGGGYMGPTIYPQTWPGYPNPYIGDVPPITTGSGGTSRTVTVTSNGSSATWGDN